MSHDRRWRASLAGLLTLTLTMAAAACSSEPNEGAPGSSARESGASAGITAAPFDGTYRAVIRRTTDGIPHITGANDESVTFGQGYASGEDYACTLADQLLKIQGRRAEFLGAGDADANVNSDFAWRTIGIDALARKDYPTQPDDVKAVITAFTAGWNHQLAVTGADKVKGWCAGASWLTPITPEDLYAYARSVALNASSTQLVRYLGTAKPPSAAQPAALTLNAAASITATPVSDSSEKGRSNTIVTTSGTDSSPYAVALDEFAAGLAPLAPQEPVGSNGWAIGRERSADGGGMLLANPHFPWEGELRFWEVQLTVPGRYSIYGAQLQGLPGVGIGFTDQFGWTHTVSAGHRFTAYTLDLVPGKPTSYRYDNGEHQMTSRVETVKVKQADGTTIDQQRTLWFSEYGPILDFPGIGWSPTMTTTFRDANLNDTAFVKQYLAMDKATSFDEFKKAHEDFQGVPLFNTIATSRDGRAWYADTSATPNLSAEALRQYDEAAKTPGITKIAADAGAVLLDGSKSVNQWVDTPGARNPGLVPYSRMPQTERPDYVFNANDSFWLNHAGSVLEGDYSSMHGPQRTARTPRTRENAVVLSDTSSTGPAGGDGKFSLTELRDAALLDRGFTSRVLKDAVVARCQAATVVAVPDLPGADGTVMLPAESVDIGGACRALAAWDGSYNLDSRGAHVWREFIGRFETAQFSEAGALWATRFDPADPINTPGGLAPAPASGADPVLVNVARAVQIITKAGVALDAPLGTLQFADRNGERIPLHGGDSSDGVTNIVGYSSSFGSSEPFPTRGPTFAPRSALTANGYQVDYGTSFLMALDYTPSGPEAWAIVTYGETGDRTSPWFSSQTKRFSAKDWRKVLLTDADVTADPQLTEKSVSSS